MALLVSFFGKGRRGACLLGLLGLLLLAPPVVAAGAGYVVAPVNKGADLRLLPSEAWPPPEGSRADILIKLAYLRGVMDALQYLELAPRSAERVLNAYQGLSLQDLAARIDAFYLTDPRRRDLPPAVVLFRLLAPAGKDAPAVKGPAPPGGQGGRSGK